MEKIIDYKISVEGKKVTLEILHQGPEVKTFFKDSQKTFGKIKFGNRAHLSLSSVREVFLMGVSSRKTDSLVLSSASAAFTYAADLTEGLELLIEEIKKDSEKKAKAVKKPGSSNFEYSVTVSGSEVTFKVLKQETCVTKFFRTAKSVGIHQIESYVTPEIREIGSAGLDTKYRVYIMGTSSRKETTQSFDSNSAALKAAATITEIFDQAQKEWPDVFGTGPKKTKVLNIQKTDFESGIVYVDTTDGELYLNISYSNRTGFSLSEDCQKSYAYSSSSWVPVGNLKKAIEIFGSDFTKSNVLKKFRSLNKTAVKQPWHK